MNQRKITCLFVGSGGQKAPRVCCTSTTACAWVWAEPGSWTGYSRMVAFLKVLLPLAALVLLSTVFLMSRSVDTKRDHPFAEQGDGRPDARPTGDQTLFLGTTAKGDEVMVTALIARPGGGTTPAEATDLAPADQNGRRVRDHSGI